MFDTRVWFLTYKTSPVFLQESSDSPPVGVCPSCRSCRSVIRNTKELSVSLSPSLLPLRTMTHRCRGDGHWLYAVPLLDVWFECLKRRGRVDTTWRKGLRLHKRWTVSCKLEKATSCRRPAVFSFNTEQNVIKSTSTWTVWCNPATQISWLST